MFELAYCMETKNFYVINTETKQAMHFEDIKLTFKDVWETILQCDGCCLDSEEDTQRIFQVLLNKVVDNDSASS